MSFTVNRRNLGAHHFTVSGSDIVFPGICSYQSKFYMLNPSTVNGLSGTKSSTFTSSQLISNFVLSTSSDVTVLAADYADTNWTSLGWTPGDDAAFFTELSNFVSNNFNATAVNPELRDMVIIFTRGTIGGVAYTIPFSYVAKFGDPNRIDSFTSLLMYLDGNLTDHSSFNNTVTNTGGVTFGLGQFGQAGVFNGSQNLSIPNPGPGGLWDIGSSDFTIDFWVKWAGAAGNEQHIIDLENGGPAGWNVVMGNGGGMFFGQAGSILLGTSNGVFATNTWYHVAVVRHGNRFDIYQNGTSLVNTTNSITFTNPASTIPLFIGEGRLGPGEFFNGALDEIRISKGIARWTSNFTPPAVSYDGVTLANDLKTALLAHFDDNTDSSAYAHTLSFNNSAAVSSSDSKFGGKSLALHSASSNYVSVPFGPEFDVSNGDFTIDFWFNYVAVNGQFGFCAYQNDFHGVGLLTFNGKMGYYATSNGTSWNLLLGDTFGGTPNATGSISLQTNTWTHVAYVRSGNDWYGFINGVQDMHVNVSGTVLTGGLNFNIGRWGNGGLFGNGFIDEFRFSKGIARWVAPFTPPSSPY